MVEYYIALFLVAGSIRDKFRQYRLLQQCYARFLRNYSIGCNLLLRRNAPCFGNANKSTEGEIALSRARRKIAADVGVKIAAFAITLAVYPPAMLISMLITTVIEIIPPLRNKNKHKSGATA